MDDDTIYRQAAILALVHEQSWNMHEDQRTAIGVIADLPPVDAQRWIPVTEQLPEKYGQYLVTFIPIGGTLWTKVLIARYSDLMGIAKPSFHIGEVGKDSFVNISEQVIAWMPLPEPYKEVNRNE